jgi:tRNA-uridine 2-sulfurtransferase
MDTSNSKSVVVAMSGGVDSSVAAALLIEQGYRVTGIMLRLWSEVGRADTNRCCTPDAMSQARRVAAHLGIPFYVIDAQEFFRETVVQAFIDGYRIGNTPNPCITCNRQVRWGYLLQQAQSLGADYLATGHYACLKRDVDGNVSLWKGMDVSKDQAYVLAMLDQQQLKYTLLPLGEYTKTQVRELAHRYQLVTAERPESQDLCFLGGEDYREFIKRHQPGLHVPGEIADLEGRQIGLHSGLSDYTIGQRKGLGITSQKPLYVVAKIISTNTLVVGEKSALGESRLHATDVNWINGLPSSHQFSAMIKIRYKATPAPAIVTILSDSQVNIQFDYPMRDITPGQVAVMYQDDIILGGGTIQANSGDII